jgi:pyruvate-formate lyase-activating enzyme
MKITRSAKKTATINGTLQIWRGSIAPIIPFLLRTSRMARDINKGRILRICWETNGAMSTPHFRQMADLALESGGCIKIDLKAWNETLHIALTGVTNRQTRANFDRIAAGQGGQCSWHIVKNGENTSLAG